MLVDLTKPIKSSFLSVERDACFIIEKLFTDYPQHAKILKRLLVITEKDCLDNTSSEVYKKIEDMPVSELIKQGYIRFQPKIRFSEHEDLKSYIVITMDGFIPNPTNPQFRDCDILFFIVCHLDLWDLGDFRQRPFKIVGYIDGLLNETRMAGIGTLHFAGCQYSSLNENIGIHTLMYHAIHSTDDTLPDDKWLNGARA